MTIMHVSMPSQESCFMNHEIKNRRNQHRCVKDVGMYCSFLHGNTSHIVTIRNFSRSGLYFESEQKIKPGTFVVLRSMGSNDLKTIDPATVKPEFFIDDMDPEVCMGFRSHIPAMVQRCVKSDGEVHTPLYGIGAKIQILTD